MPTVLLTGGTGYIGSHTCVELINAGFETVLFDNLCNSSPVVIDRIAGITGTRPSFVRGDVRDRGALDSVFTDHPINVVVQFSGVESGWRLGRPTSRLLLEQRRWLGHVIRRA